MTDAGGPALFASLRGDGAMCALATQGVHFSGGGGYSYLHRDVPMFSYAPDEGARMRAEQGAFDRLIAPAATPAPPGFARIRCTSGSPEAPALCLSARTGTCRPAASPNEINRLLIRLDQ
jgi:hypothetical protein